MNFQGAKVAILVDGMLLVHLRDNAPGLFNANMWDFPGGGREGDESPLECAIREVNEELEIQLDESDFIWKKSFPAQKDPNQIAFFFVAKIEQPRIKNLVLHEGQKWSLMNQEEFLSRKNVIPAIKARFKSFLESVDLKTNQNSLS